MTVDGTFIKGCFILIILLAVRIDVNDQIILLAWAIVESENKSFWVYFFYYLHAVTEALFKEKYIIISDCDKELKALINEETENCYHAFVTTLLLNKKIRSLLHISELLYEPVHCTNFKLL